MQQASQMASSLMIAKAWTTHHHFFGGKGWNRATLLAVHHHFLNLFSIVLFYPIPKGAIQTWLIASFRVLGGIRCGYKRRQMPGETARH